tara:strand:+ start:2260 stop:2826 length:567 start_codon:yes stop_codon:yes gene_type:complete
MNLDFLLPSTLLRKGREYSRKLWVRVLIMGLLAVLSLLLSMLIERWIPQSLATYLTGSAADRLLSIIANAMLAVTTFSLSVMVTVYRSTSTQWTPRIHRLIVQDRTTQNTLAVFIGAYVYALIAIILRELGVFDDKRFRVVRDDGDRADGDCVQPDPLGAAFADLWQSDRYLATGGGSDPPHLQGTPA